MQPNSSPKRLAFIIQAHKHPAQVRRLIDKLHHPQVDCFLHIDSKCNIADWESLFHLPNVFIVPKRANVTWAGWGIIQASINSMEAVLAAGQQYAYITLMSGQDYTLKPIEEIYDFLCNVSSHTQFMDVISDEALAPMMTKMNEYHFVEYNFPGKYKFGKLLTKLLPRRKAPYRLKLYCGSAWWTLTQDCVEYCIQYERSHPLLRRYFKLTWGADEFIFQTILMNSKYREQITKDNLHYIDWSAGLANPKTFQMEDYNALLQSGKPFARKFDFHLSGELMDKLDTEMDRNYYRSISQS